MNSPSKNVETSPSTSANGKKLKQARLPFKTLTTAPSDDAPKSNEKRKRKLSVPNEEEFPVSKQNRTENELITIDLLSSETLESSVEYFGNTKSESKENVEILDDSMSDGSNLVEPKAKKCLDLNGTSNSDSEQLITIKLPMMKKATKKQKKNRKSVDAKKSIDVESEEEAVNGHDESVLPEDENKSDEEQDTSVLNESAVSVFSENGDKVMTPRQVARKAELEKKMLERQRQREDRQREKDEKEQQRKREREEKEQQKKKEREEKEDQKRKEREEKEEQKRKEREEKEQKRLAEIEEKERKRQAEVDARNERKRLQEQQKEEERLRKEEEKKQRDEAEQMKNRKTAAAFVKFFVPKKSDGKSDGDVAKREQIEQMQSSTDLFMSFQIKEDMKVAPIWRRQLDEHERAALENVLDGDKHSEMDEKKMYLASLKRGDIEPKRSGKTWVSTDDSNIDEDDIFVLEDNGHVQVIEEKPKKKNYRAKFFKFCENRRPPYFGTWRKRSSVLKPRRPFVLDKKFFDYEIDSDDEWEEEEPGESLHGSDDDEDKEPEDDYDIDNEFFVPHGHLSDEELMREDELDDDDEDTNPEAQKAKLKFIQDEFADEMKKKTEKLKPRILGLIWQNADGTKPNDCSNGIWNLFQTHAFMLNGSCVSVTPSPSKTAAGDSSDESENGQKNSVRRLKIGEREVPDLIRLVNGNINNCNFLIKEFRAFIAKNQAKAREYSIASIRGKIKELAQYKLCPEEGPMHKKMCWYVPIETRERYGLDNLKLPNSWQYTLTPRRTMDFVEQPKESDNKEKEKERVKPSKENRRRLTVDIDSDDVLCLSDSNSCGLSESVTSETVKQASTKSANFNIAKFIRPLSAEEKRKQFGSLTLRRQSSEQSSQGDSSAATEQNETKKPTRKKTESIAEPLEKKRAQLLVSVPCGTEVSPKLKNTLVTQFLNNNPRKRKASGDVEPTESSTTAACSSNKRTAKDRDVILID